MTIHLFPHYVTVDSAETFSPMLFEFLEQQGVSLEPAYWEGSLDSLPTSPSIIRGSSRMKCGWRDLGERCAELGHFCFYDDQVLLSDGTLSAKLCIDEVKKFIAKQVATA